MRNSDTQDSPWPRLAGGHHLPPYSILCASPRGPHPNGFLSQDSQVGVPKFPQLGLPQLWRRITSYVDLRLQWGLKQSCSPGQEIFNGMSHATWTQGNRVDSWLLVVGSRIVNLTPSLSFGHNLCFRCPNERCEPILNIYTSISFQLYEELFKEMGFDPYNCALKVRESFWDSNSQHGSSLGSVRVHAFAFYALLGACEVTLGSPSWPTTLQPPCLGHEPKARVATWINRQWHWWF
jgi:hypothetical protein